MLIIKFLYSPPARSAWCHLFFFGGGAAIANCFGSVMKHFKLFYYSCRHVYYLTIKLGLPLPHWGALSDMKKIHMLRLTGKKQLLKTFF